VRRKTVNDSVEVDDGGIEKDHLRALIFDDRPSKISQIFVCFDAARMVCHLREMEMYVHSVRLLLAELRNPLSGGAVGRSRESKVRSHMGDSATTDNVNNFISHEVLLSRN
jgi:hypothetical protein